MINLKIEYSVNSKTQLNVFRNRKKIKINVVFVVLLTKNKTKRTQTEGQTISTSDPCLYRTVLMFASLRANLLSVKCVKLARTTTATPLLFIRNI